MLTIISFRYKRSKSCGIAVILFDFSSVQIVPLINNIYNAESLKRLSVLVKKAYHHF